MASPARRASGPHNLGAALQYARSGFAVFPLGVRSKHPRISKEQGGHGCHDATTDAAQITAWWTEHPHGNIGIATGAPSGVVVLDVDPKNGATYDELAERYDLPETLTALSGRGDGGRHLYFQHPGFAVSNDSKGIVIGKGYDLKGDGGYVVAPPSIHPDSGKPYTWLNEGTPIAPMPAWLLDAVKTRQERQTQPANVTPLSRFTDDGSKWLGEALAKAHSGQVGRDDAGHALAIQLLCNQVADPEGVMRSYAAACPAKDHPYTEADALRNLESARTSRIVQKGEPARRLSVVNFQATRYKSALATNQNDIDETPTDSAADSDPRPLIIAKGRQLREVIADAIDALEAANNPPILFQRGGSMVRLRTDENGRTIVDDADDRVLRYRLTQVANFARWQREGKDDLGNPLFTAAPIAPPDELVKTLPAEPRLPFPGLVSVTETPIMRPDGSILDTPGYDEATAVYYQPQPAFSMPTIPTHPTRTDLTNAVRLVKDMLIDFKFDGEASTAHAYALYLTAVIRTSIAGKVPFGLVVAPASGSGKTLLANGVSVIGTGRESTQMRAPTNEEEWSKSITSVLRDATPVVLVDNVRGALNSSSLETLATSDIWKARLLGKNESAEYPHRGVWIVTGNNLQLAGDMPRRCYRIRLDAQTARPERRKGFKHGDFIGYLKRHRGALVAALLTMARAWYAAGCPEPEEAITPMGSYEEWSRVVGGILAYAGVKGFLSDLDEMYEDADSERPQWAGFFSQWRTVYGDDVKTASEVAKDACDLDHPMHAALPEALAPLADKPNALTRKLGAAFRDQCERRYEEPKGVEIWLRKSGQNRSNTTTWRVVAKPLGDHPSPDAGHHDKHVRHGSEQNNSSFTPLMPDIAGHETLTSTGKQILSNRQENVYGAALAADVLQCPAPMPGPQNTSGMKHAGHARQASPAPCGYEQHRDRWNPRASHGGALVCDICHPVVK